ncbi:MAG: hypothetical protein LH702_04675 [Phormidesmis sp. CAN_BIN44]|nr:hypothetical protein [Phormidesmis sp. CAN_BIN44]
MLAFYQELYYLNPQTDFEKSVNSNLDNLCFQSGGCGWEAIRAQTYLKKLKSFSQNEREQAYHRAIAYLRKTK